MVPSHKDEALRALYQVREGLLSLEKTQTGLNQRLLLATLEYAVEQIGQVQELKRARKPKPSA